MKRRKHGMARAAWRVRRWGEGTSSNDIVDHAGAVVARGEFWWGYHGHPLRPWVRRWLGARR
jgi:hypothetical protein